jgi:methylglutaconyl-CoA hydratase
VIEAGTVDIAVQNGVGEIMFSHPKSNSLPASLLREIAAGIDTLSADPACAVIVLKSGGEKAFCAGASFDEFLAVDNQEVGQKFFMGFGLITLAIKRSPKFVISRVQGKVVGGGVGIVAASDYSLATDAASVRLSELAIGIAPFVIGPAVQRKVGLHAFNAMAIDADWRNAQWAKDNGLFVDLFPSIEQLDEAVGRLAETLAGYSPDAMKRLKGVLWEGTDHWEELMASRAAVSGELMLTDFVRNWIANFKSKNS